jgi:hypothetical protein
MIGWRIFDFSIDAFECDFDELFAWEENSVSAEIYFEPNVISNNDC